MNPFKGVILSGGQRARVGLARAIYAKADIYVLDDPLAAVDIEVALQIYTNCVQGFLKSKTRILITHRYQFLTEADNILYLDNGEQQAFGNFNHIMGYDSQFIKSLKTSYEEIKRKQPRVNSHSELDEKFLNLQEPKEFRATGTIGVVDLIYFLRACGSNIVWFSIALNI